MNGNPSHQSLLPMPPPRLHKQGCHFSVWAPEKNSMTLSLPDAIDIPMQKDDHSYFHADDPGIKHGDKYHYIPEGKKPCPAPASPWQPNGVHGSSAVVDHQLHPWTDENWR